MWAKLKRIGMTVLFATFTLLGAGIAVFGDGPNRLLGLAVVLFMGGGGVAWFVVTAGRPRTDLRIGTVSAFDRYETGFIADYDSRRQLVGSAGALAMGTAAALFGFVPDGEGSTVVHPLLGAGLGALMGGIGLLGIMKAGRGSQVVLLPRGVAAISAPGPIFVPWNTIAAIGEMEVRGSPFLVIQVTDSTAVEMSRLQRLMHVLQRSLMNVDLSFPLLAMRTDPHQLRAALERYLEHPELRSSIGTAAELAAVVRDSASSPAEAADEPRPARTPRSRGVAAASLLLVGALLAIVSLAAALDEVTPAQERGRLLGLVIFGVLALVHVGAGILVLRGVGVGRWIGLAGALAVLAFGVLGLVRSDADSRTAGVVIVGILAVHTLLVAWGAVRWRGKAAPSRRELHPDTADGR
jgi:hypothetical protein